MLALGRAAMLLEHCKVENMNWAVVGRSGGLAGTDWAIGGVPYMLVRFQLVQGPFSARRFLGG